MVWEKIMLILAGEKWRKRDERESDENQKYVAEKKNSFEMMLWRGSIKYENVNYTQKNAQTHTSMRALLAC